MNSRERVLATINHQETDSVPLDLGATPSSGISVIAYNKLKEYLQIKKGHTRVYDVVQQLAQVEDLILDKFKIDVVDIGRKFNTNDDDWYQIELADGSKAEYPSWFKPEYNEKDNSFAAYSKDGTMIARMPEGATFFDQTIFPYIDGYPSNYNKLSEAMDKVLWSALVHSPWDNLDNEDFWKELRDKAIDLRDNSDRAIMINCGCNLFEWGTFLRRIDNFLMDIYTCPDEVEKLLDALLEKHLAFLEKVCESVGDIVDIVRLGDDLGMDKGPFMSPEVYRKIFKPRHKILCDYIKKHSQMHTFLHSCGSIYKFLPDLIEAGFGIINPVQTSAREMEPEILKGEFGQDITFWGGGCNTRSVLNHGSPQEVKDYVKRMLDIFMPGGGFVFNQEHNIMPDVPAENIVAMYEAVDEFK